MSVLVIAVFVSAGSPEPSPLIFFLIFPLIWMAISLLVSLMLGIFSLYREFPADGADVIEDSFGWVQMDFGTFRGHAPMSLRLGRRALHIKEVFPFQPLFWLGPASIPWTEITQVRRVSESSWHFWSAAEFTVGARVRRLRLRGRAARALQARLDALRGNIPTAIVPC